MLALPDLPRNDGKDGFWSYLVQTAARSATTSGTTRRRPKSSTRPSFFQPLQCALRGDLANPDERADFDPGQIHADQGAAMDGLIVIFGQFEHRSREADPRRAVPAVNVPPRSRA